MLLHLRLNLQLADVTHWGVGTDIDFVNAMKQCRNLVSFGPVTPDIARLECVQWVSISTGVNLAVFARGRHC